MLRKSWFLFLLFGIAVAVLILLSGRTAERQYNWAPLYTAAERQPFGCLIVNDYLGDMFEGKVSIVRNTINDHFRKSEILPSNYIIINSNFEPTLGDVDQLCRFASFGGSVFISANSFGLLSDTLDLWVDEAPQTNLFINSGNPVKDFENSKGDTLEGINFSNPKLHEKNGYSFAREYNQFVFLRIDTLKTTALGYDQFENLNFIRVQFGQGEFLLHTIPNAFTNYYMSTPTTANYGFKALSYLPIRQTWWDEHYKDGLKEDRDTRRFLLSQPALKLSYLILVVTGTLLLFFGGKRRQKPVPVQPPVINTTLAFVETIGSLYYREGNNQDIITKKINYFLTSIRTRFNLQTNLFDEVFLLKVANLSGVSYEQTQHLFRVIDAQRNQPNSTDQALRILDQLIWDFNQRSKR